MLDYYRRIYEEYYGRYARIYDPFVRSLWFLSNRGFGGERRWRELIVDWLDPHPGEKIIDICSGTGTLTIMIARRLGGRGKVIGLELSPAQLSIARKKEKPEGLHFLEGDAQQIPFLDSYFDKGVICTALHEMPQEVRKNVLSEAYRIIRPGGRMVNVEQNKPERKWKAKLFDFLESLGPEYITYKNMLKCGLTEEIKRAGFRVVKTDTTLWEFMQIVLAEK